jgi:hypothetical protein
VRPFVKARARQLSAAIDDGVPARLASYFRTTWAAAISSKPPESMESCHYRISTLALDPNLFGLSHAPGAHLETAAGLLPILKVRRPAVSLWKTHSPAR